MNSTDRNAVAALTCLVLVTCLPFVRRAYFVDDYYHVTMARGLLDHPLRPYDFVADDAGYQNKGWEAGQAPRMVNPPLFHYFLALVMKLWGNAVWKLRTASLLFPVISVLCAYFLGKRFVDRPGSAAALMALTPAFWLTSYSLLIDGMLMAFFLASLLTFFIAQERRSITWVIFSGVLMGLTLLVKYFGVLIIPLALLWQGLDPERRRWRPGYIAYGIAAVLLLMWGLWGIATYGQMHLIATLPRGFQGRTSLLNYAAKSLAVASFIGGSTFFILVCGGMLAARSKKLFLLLLLTAAALCAVLTSSAGGFGRLQALMIVFFSGSTVAFLLLVASKPLCLDHPREWFLELWLGLGILELIVIMPWTAARYLLLIVPPLVWMFQRILNDAGWRGMWRAAVLATAVVGGILAYVDYAQAHVIVDLAHALAWEQRPPFPGAKYYLGDTFTGYEPYLGPLGWRAAFPDTLLKPGDLLLVPRYRTSSWWKLPHPERLHPVGRIEFPSRWPIRLMDVPASAGFYASCWGALPFAITRHPLEQFDLFQVR